VSALELPPSTDSVPVARQFARRVAGDCSADVETLVLLVSEVVTNAVLHARSDIRLDVQSAEDLVRVEVHDASPIEPRVHHFHVTSGTGPALGRRGGPPGGQGRLVRGR
jgi:anti-sigma regulatory factor (Ser/Thr protein kinase)